NDKPGAVKVKLGPSANFAAEWPRVRKERGKSESSVLHFTKVSGLAQVDVVLNGVVTTPMLVDSGASTILLTADTAKKLHLQPGKDDPVINLQTADGKTTKGRATHL